jgi:putative transposase
VPWRTTTPVNERMTFVARILEQGERVSDLCKEYGISRKTGHKYLKAYKEHGADGLYDASRAPGSSPHRISKETCELFVKARKKHPTWGPKKLCAWLESQHEGIRLPCASTVGDLLKREGLTQPRKRRKRIASPTDGPLTKPTKPNEVWAVDFKGQFRLGNGGLCYPLTVTDVYSRYLVACVGLDSTAWAPTQLVFTEVFREFGLPKIIRSDNGTPFSSVGLCGLSRLSAWWRVLGVRGERIEPGQPQQNGQHERMHRTLKAEATRPAAANLLQQQERFDRFREEFNCERPHEALKLKTPASVFVKSPRPFEDPPPVFHYPHHDVVRVVMGCGSVRFESKRVFLSASLAGHTVGLRELDDGRWLVSFLDLDLGVFDRQTSQLTCGSA